MSWYFIAGVDRAFLGYEITHMTVGSHDVEVFAKKFFDRFRLCRRLDYNEIF
jgi:hypothetical protein